MTLKPWREIAVPHPDVLQGTFQQSEFAADLTAVHTGQATQEYQDARAFFERTFITEGMRLLLTSVARRLQRQGGDPVIQLQTTFGGGKTHTLLAVYHLAHRTCSLDQLSGIPALLDQAGLLDVPTPAWPFSMARRWRPANPGHTAPKPFTPCGANWLGNSAVTTAMPASKLPMLMALPLVKKC